VARNGIWRGWLEAVWRLVFAKEYLLRASLSFRLVQRKLPALTFRFVTNKEKTAQKSEMNTANCRVLTFV
jgi:hypothetical protein